MPRYFISATYSPDAPHSVRGERATARRVACETCEKLSEGLRGRIESFHCAYGDHVCLIADMPGDPEAASLVAALARRDAETISMVRLTPAEASEQLSERQRVPA